MKNIGNTLRQGIAKVVLPIAISVLSAFPVYAQETVFDYFGIPKDLQKCYKMIQDCAPGSAHTFGDGSELVYRNKNKGAEGHTFQDGSEQWKNVYSFTHGEKKYEIVEQKNSQKRLDKGILDQTLFRVFDREGNILEQYVIQDTNKSGEIDQGDLII